jgi:hypothetical protein
MENKRNVTIDEILFNDLSFYNWERAYCKEPIRSEDFEFEYERDCVFCGEHFKFKSTDIKVTSIQKPKRAGELDTLAYFANNIPFEKCIEDNWQKVKFVNCPKCHKENILKENTDND